MSTACCRCSFISQAVHGRSLIAINPFSPTVVQNCECEKITHHRNHLPEAQPEARNPKPPPGLAQGKQYDRSMNLLVMSPMGDTGRRNEFRKQVLCILADMPEAAEAMLILQAQNLFGIMRSEVFHGPHTPELP